MSIFSWFCVVICIAFWITFFWCIRETRRMGMKVHKLGVFWFCLTSISVLSVLTLVLTIQGTI